MKKILLTLALLLLFIPGVNAQTLYCNHTNKYSDYFERFGEDFVIEELNDLLELYNNEYSKEYPFYYITVNLIEDGNSFLQFNLDMYDDPLEMSWQQYNTTSTLKQHHMYNFTIPVSKAIRHKYRINSDNSLTLDTAPHSINSEFISFYSENNNYFDCTINLPFYSNINPLFVMPQIDNLTQINLQTSPRVDNYDVFTENSNNYTYKQYSTFLKLDPSLSNYTEVNLDNYEYVILNLKNYNKTDAFDTNLQVKGMIGITPVYEFGTIEKTEITDRCNISYSDYIDHRLYILKNDLINNAVYYVKSCQNGSSFKFDSSIFNITYVTADNVDDPVITLGGKEYHTIPFNKLSNSANQNEENNFIPGESENSLTDIIDNISKFTNDIWDAVSSFMGLVTKFFNTLPPEIRYLSITGFTVLIFISIIKFMKG